MAEDLVNLSQDFERVPVKIRRHLLEELQDFEYFSRNFADTEELDPTILTYPGCSCQALSCNIDTNCQCITRFKQNHYINTVGLTRLSASYYDNSDTNPPPPIYECNTLCKCSSECRNRLVQNGVQMPLVVDRHDDGKKGLCVLAGRHISAGEFVCEYAGQVITLEQARLATASLRPGRDMNYVIAVKEHAGHDSDVTLTIIDPRRRGNVGRFINHSCGPNLVMIPVRSDSHVPMLALFARRPILAGEELGFHYNGGDRVGSDGDEKAGGELTVCRCGAVSCSGFLPFDRDIF